MSPTNPSTLHPNPSLAALPYNPALSLWLSVDPLSDKYPNLSPYVYCANNPVRLVDVDGREIWVGSFYYRDGNLYDRGGNIHVAESAFEQKALESLNTLYGTRQGFEMMNPLMGTNEVNVYIKEASKSEWNDVIASGETGKNIGGTIYWNSHGTKVPVTNGWDANAVTDLGHEFSHAYDDLVGYDYKIGMCGGISTTEWQAVYRENLIRSDLGQPLRTHYKTRNDPDYWYPSIRGLDAEIPDGPYMLKNGKPYFPDNDLIEDKNTN